METNFEKKYTSYSISLGDGHVLAVEDSIVQAKMLKYFFESNNINAKIFGNAEDALESARQNPPVLVVSDIVMPGMDGYQFCRTLKNDPLLGDLPVILLTSLHDPLDIVKGLQAGADNFITKPYEEQYLLSRIQYLLANRDMRRSGAGDMVIEIVFQGNKYQINSDKKQILNLLLSVYEAAINRNNELLEAKQQLEDTNLDLKSAVEQLDAFARTVSHDLKSPLVGILGFTDLILEEHASHLDEEIVTNHNFILSSAQKMSDLITDLLNFSRSSKVEIKSEQLNLSHIASEIMEDIRIRVPKRVINFEVENDLIAFADLSLVTVLLNNLLGNAVKYSGKKEQSNIVFGSSIIYGKKVLFVKDNGAGFDMTNSGKLFSPFVRLHTSNEFPGTGIGLSTAKNICQRHGGDIWVESEPGVGSTFYFTLSEDK